MAKKFDFKSLPVPNSKNPNLLGQGNEKGAALIRPKSIETVQDKYRNVQSGTTTLMGLSDATGSMVGLWSKTRDCIVEVVSRISSMGTFRMKWCAYRDYGDGNLLFEASPWCQEASPLLDFIRRIHCTGGDDFPEAVEVALRHAAEEQEAVSRVILIGDAPPHLERDYRNQAQRLGQLNRAVFAFRVGQHKETEQTFREIADLSGGKYADLTSADDLVDFLVLTAVDDIGGAAAVEEYLRRYQLTAGSAAAKYAGLLTKGQ